MSTDTKTEAQRRHHIQQGREGDKITGFDPAASPMETDAEAGGSPTDAPIIPPRDNSPADANATSFGTAMRPFPPAGSSFNYGTTISVAVVALVILLLAIVYW